MKIIKISTLSLIFLLAVSSCNNGGGDSLSAKKAKLSKLQSDRDKADEEIKNLENEIAKLDTSANKNVSTKLVAVEPVQVQNFKHYIDLQAKVDAENISYISPRGMAGQVKAVYVKQGQKVSKGQLLLKLDDAIVQQQVNAARQQLAGIKTQLNYAKNIYDRQKNLWDKGIGTEVQLISAKTNVEGLQDQLKSANEQIKVAVEQANTSNVYSDVSGIADVVNVRVGEVFSGVTAAGPQIKIVNTNNLKVVASVPENYISRFKTGLPVEINIPDLNKTIESKISYLGQSIDPTKRGFTAEAKIPYDASIKPDQTATLKVMDFSIDSTIVIPVNVVQTDETGKYVYVMMEKNGVKTAVKKVIEVGDVYGNNMQVKSGLSNGENIITEGYQNLYDGQVVSDKVL